MHSDLTKPNILQPSHYQEAPKCTVTYMLVTPRLIGVICDRVFVAMVQRTYQSVSRKSTKV